MTEIREIIGKLLEENEQSDRPLQFDELDRNAQVVVLRSMARVLLSMWDNSFADTIDDFFDDVLRRLEVDDEYIEGEDVRGSLALAANNAYGIMFAKVRDYIGSTFIIEEIVDELSDRDSE